MVRKALGPPLASGDDPFIGHLTLDQFDQVFRWQVWQDPSQPELDWPSANRRY
jgi:hypothetical protein